MLNCMLTFDYDITIQVRKMYQNGQLLVMRPAVIKMTGLYAKSALISRLN
jgi:hypothetical protein